MHCRGVMWCGSSCSSSKRHSMSLRVVTTLMCLLASWLTRTPCLWRSMVLMFIISRHTLQRCAFLSHVTSNCASLRCINTPPTLACQLQVCQNLVPALYVCFYMNKCSAFSVQARPHDFFVLCLLHFPESCTPFQCCNLSCPGEYGFCCNAILLDRKF